ncbi:uncharacterized protein LOC128952475 [Oppia nitens]|uniref:uncharacterized protein LOC128952475 n=1 Tax=Oppia nitens TaxID=1686743 RepID=UPI0023D99B14|nr:uncharacterized protein LOC128952475 [Oppia nitens]
MKATIINFCLTTIILLSNQLISVKSGAEDVDDNPDSIIITYPGTHHREKFEGRPETEIILTTTDDDHETLTDPDNWFRDHLKLDGRPEPPHKGPHREKFEGRPVNDM